MLKHDKQVVLVPAEQVAHPVEHAKQAFPLVKYFPTLQVKHELLPAAEHVKQLKSHNCARRIHWLIPYCCPD